MQIPKNLLGYIEQEAKNIRYGRIIIELNETSDKVDVITENRERFHKNCEENSKNLEKVIRNDA